MKNLSKRNQLGIILGLFIVTLLVLFYIEKTNKVIAPEPEPAGGVAYYCTEGILKVVYEKNEAEITFPNGEAKTFTQSISADGARYESGNRVFWGKGDTAFVTEWDKNIYTNCVTGSIVSGGTGFNIYTDPSKLFSFTYPKEFNFSGGDGSYTEDWSTQSSGALGMFLAKVYIPKSFMPGTNFSEAKFTIGTSSYPDAVKNCLGAQKNLSDAGAGNLYETTTYRYLKNNQCYSVEYTIHSTNIGNYPPESGIKEFDKAKVQNILKAIVESFKFL